MKKNLNNYNPIGFFDSGVGGLSVFAKFKELLPFENTIYFGDLKHMPYGNKTKKELLSYARSILNFFVKNNVKAVVIACNTSSATIYDVIKNEYNFPIFPIIQSSAKVISSMNIKTLGIFATDATVKSNAYLNEISKYNENINIIQIACPNWVKFVENNQINSISCKTDIKNNLDCMMKYSPDKIILGCTHYPYLLNNLISILNYDIFIDPANIFVNFIKAELEKMNLLNINSVLSENLFFVSSSPELFLKNAKFFYKLDNMPQLINL